MTEAEKRFKASILKKIKDYDIKDKKKTITINDCLKHATNKFVTTRYYDGREELIDTGIETYLCQCSPYYFISEYCSFTLPGVGELSAKTLYYYQKEILKDFVNWKKVVLTKSRQTGLSTLMALIFFWKIIFFRKEWGVIISKDSTSAEDVLGKIKENLKNIPFWLGLKIIANNSKTLKFSNGSRIQSFARSPSAGRGTSPTIALLDEFAFYQTKRIAEGIISSVVPSLTATNGNLYIISTPNGTSGEGELYYKQVQELKNAGGKNEMEGAVLYDVQWWMCPDKIQEGGGPYKGYNDKLQDYESRDFWNNPNVKKEAEEFFRPIAEKPKENPWLSFQFSTSGEVKYRQEILQDFVVMGNSVFSASTIERMIANIKPPIKEGDLGSRYYKGLWYWKMPEKGHRYAIGADVAKGTADDSTAINVVDIDTAEIVAEYLGRCSTKEGGKLINDLGKYYNEAYLVVECNSIGEAIFNDLYYVYNYPNMFKMQKINKHDRTKVWTGWMTTSKTRDLITDNFIDTIGDDENAREYGFYSSRLVDQCKTWVWAGGRPDHTEGCHDDDILSLAIILYNLPKARQILTTEGGQKPTLLIDEKGRSVSVGGVFGEKMKYYDEHDVMDRQGYIDAEEKMAKLTGAPEGYCEDALDIYRWLIS